MIEKIKKLESVNYSKSSLIRILNILLSFPSLIIICFLIFNNNRFFLFLSITNLSICAFLVITIKNIVKKRRPDERFFKKRIFSNHYSLPSGHLSSNISLFFLLKIFHNNISFLFFITSILVITYKIINDEHDFYDLFYAIFLGLFCSILSTFLFFYFYDFIFKKFLFLTNLICHLICFY